MAKMSVDELLDVFKGMTLLELSEFLKAFEEQFGVSGTPMMAPVATDAPGNTVEAVEEQSEFDVILESFGDKKIQVIKAIREVVPGLGLKEAKDLVEAAPARVLEQVDQIAADTVRIKLEAAGARVSLK
ncbi:50S ribosomal protein L7/L12 [Nocardia sp. NPDC051030]|uniref:50S ribosomal protein L7/L12 n=1 Tax=Nocardia sp. NPDC051030 TaxID=3155162 RepID=UPI0034475F19